MDLPKMLLLCTIVSLCFSADASSNNNSLCHKPTSCTCTAITPYLVECNNMELKSIPEIKEDRTVQWMLEVQQNSVTSITKFPTAPNLVSLVLQHNQISKIEDFAFENLANLWTLNLKHNTLTIDSFTAKSFAGLQETSLPLSSLDLSFNNIIRLSADIFKHLRNLTVLNLSHNRFADMSLSTAQAISQLHNLKKLDLSYTNLQRLPDHMFSDLTSLNNLDLSGNDFVTIPEEVNYARSLRTLTINNNLLGLLHSHSFWENLKDLETLRMAKSNTLFRIEDGAFGNLTSLKVLFLNDNIQLSSMTSRSFTNRHNQTPHLRELHLQNNQFETLPEDALPWSDIHLLNLKRNPWNCDCRLEWLAKGVMMSMLQTGNYLQAENVLCASPVELIGLKLTDQIVQTSKLVCRKPASQMDGYGFLVVATIVVGTLLLFTGTILFAYILFKRSKVQDWLGNNVKYRRTTLNDDEEIVTSTTQY